jgi:DNA-binding NarL/FixJ family response regulator
MAEDRASTLIVARPGPLRDGIEALLASVAQVEVVGKAELASTALSIAAEHPLDLLLLDAGLPGSEAGRLLQACRRQRPGLRCIALADDAAQERAARASGADAALLKGFPADRFAETVEQLLSDHEPSG